MNSLYSFLTIALFSAIPFLTKSQDLRPGVLRVKIKEQYAQDLQKQTLANGQFGISNIDAISKGLDVKGIRRLFRESGKFEKVHRQFGLHLWYEITFDPATLVNTAIKAYQNVAEFEIVEPLQDYHAIKPVDFRLASPSITALTDPTDDPLFQLQWHYQNTGQSGGTPGADISLPQAWSLQTGDPNVIVAVIDGGVDVNHPDLTASMWVNENEIPGNGLDDDDNGYVDDIYGYGFGDNTGTIYPDYHGTHVAGTIAAVTNNGVGVSGIAGGSGSGNGVRLMSCAGFGQFGTGGFEDAMVYAADNGAVISQNSWGGGSQAIEDAIDYFIARAGYDNSDENFDDNIQTGPMAGGIVIFAAGNSNTDNTSIGYPASYSPVMAVASTTHTDEKSWFSNFGSWVDIAAPGSDVYSTYPTALGSYAYLSGTSMACPHVSGVAALIISEFSATGLQPFQVWDRLQFTSDDIDDLNPGYEGELGSGRLNAFQALQVEDDIPPASVADFAITAEKLNSVVLQWTAPGASGTEGAASYYDIRYSTSPITSLNFDEATIVANSPRPQLSGTLETFELKGLLHSTTYYFALKTRDFFGNLSDISNTVSGSTLPPPVIGVAPPTIEEDLFTGGSTVSYLTVTNTGASDLIIDLRSESLSASTASVAPGKLRTESRTLKGLTTVAIESLKPYVTITPRDGKRMAPGNLMEVRDHHRHSAGRLFALNHTTGFIDELHPETGELLNEIPAPEAFSGGPDGLTFDGTYLYFLNGFGTNTIHRIDPTSGTLQGSLALGAVSVDGLAHSGELIYVLDYSGRIYEIDFDDGEVLRTITPPVTIGGGISYGGTRGTLFVSNFEAGIYEIDVETGAVVNSLPSPGVVYGLGYSDALNLLFVANVSTGNADALDPETGSVLFSLPGVLSAAMASDEAGNRWLIPGDEITTIAPGTSAQVPVTLDAQGLNGGTYLGEVHVISNDPITPLVEIPVTLNVTGAPNLNLSLSEIHFPETYAGQQSVIELLMKNNGTDALDITNVAILEAGFTENGEAITLAVGESTTIAVTFLPDVEGAFEGNLTIESNDPDEPSISIPLFGTSVTPPVIGVDPAALSTALLTGASVTETLTISNTGGSSLFWNASATTSSPESVLHKEQEYFLNANFNDDGVNNSNQPVSSRIEPNVFPLAAGDFTSKSPSSVPLTSFAVDPTTGFLYGQADAGVGFYRYDPQLNAWATLTSCPVNSGNNGGAAYLDGKIYTTYTQNGGTIGVYTITTDSWTTISNGLFSGTGNITSDGDELYLLVGYVLKKYDPANDTWTTLASPPFSFEPWGGLSYHNGMLYGHQGNGYAGFAKYDIAANSWTVLPNVPGGAVLGSAIDPTAKKYFAYGSYSGTNWYSFDFTTSTWSAGTIPLFSVNDGGLAYVGKAGFSGIYFLQGQSGTGLGRFETAPSFTWLSVDPLEDELPAGQDQQVAVTFDATGLYGGVYSGVIEFYSNDPDNAVIEVPVTMTVTGAPDIDIEQTDIDYENVYVGIQKDTALVIANSGTDVLTISAIDSDNPVFTVVGFTPVEILPEESETITVRFLPAAAASYEGTLTIHSDDPDQSTVEVVLTGTGVLPPIMIVTPAELSADLLTGQSTTRVVTIENVGHSVLTWNLAVEISLPSALSALHFQPKENGSDIETLSVALNTPHTNLNTQLQGGPHRQAPGNFTSRADSPVPLTCVTSDPMTGIIYAQANQGYQFYSYHPATNLWTTLASSPLYSGNNGGATFLNGKVYTVYTSNSTSLGVYTVSTNSWTTIGSALGSGTGQITTDGTYLYLAAGSILARYDPSNNLWTTLSSAPIHFTMWGGLSYANGTIYGHQGDGSTGFAKYTIATNSWASLPHVPGGAVLGSAIDPVTGKYYTYGSYSGNNFYAYDPAINAWSVASIPMFSVSDGGLAAVRTPVHSGIYFVRGEFGSGFGRFETLPFEDWLAPSPLSGEIAPGESAEVTVEISANQLPGGVYTGTLVVSGNDPANASVDIPVTLTVTSAPQIITESTLNFQEAYVGVQNNSSINILNAGTAPLTISTVSSDHPNFLVDFSETTLPPSQSVDVEVSFQSEVPGEFSGILSIHTNDPDEPLVQVSMSASATVPPLTVSPSLIEFTLPQFSSGNASLTISNQGAGILNWSIESTADELVSLEDVKQSLIDNYVGIVAQIPGRYDFSGGDVGLMIDDGGGDMYDGGNMLMTNLDPWTWIPYTNGAITDHDSFGSSGQYFTLKQPGLFVLAADVNISSFTIDGNLGADGSGLVDGTVITTVRHGLTYKGFVKRVHSAWDPSVNHLIITTDNGMVNHVFSTDTNSDFHSVENLTGVNRIYHLLFASSSGGYITDESMQAIMEAFLTAISGNPPWLSFSMSGGSLESGNSETIDVMVETSHLLPGTYTAQIQINDEDILTPPFPSTVILNVTPEADIDVTPSVEFGKTYVGGVAQSILWLKNSGTAALDISSLTTDNTVFPLTSEALTIAPGDSAGLLLSFVPVKFGYETALLAISSSDPDEPNITVLLSGLGSVPPTASANPNAIEVQLRQNESRIVNVRVMNIGDEEMYWSFSGVPAWAHTDISADTLLPHSESKVKLIIDGAELPSSSDFSLLIHHNNPFQSITELPVTITLLGSGVPYMSQAIPDTVIETNADAISLNLGGYFADPDFDALLYSVQYDADFIEAAIQGSVLTINPVSQGVTDVRVRGNDPAGNFIEDVFSVSVIEEGQKNQSPYVSLQIESQELELGFKTLEFNLAENFADPDNDILIFGYTSSSDILDFNLLGSVLTINPLQPGEATVTVTAQDGTQNAEMTFLVTVYNITGIEAEGRTTTLTIHPNPFEERTLIEYAVTGDAHVQLTLLDVTGKVKQILLDEFQTAGRKAFELDATSLIPGLYICRLQINGERVATSKIIRR